MKLGPEDFYKLLRKVGDDFFVDGGFDLGDEEVKHMILTCIFGKAYELKQS